ncbi:hypothetical protein HMPREF9075_02176 [Capnocytophaga sp. oral taxon 332 str. F0381]|nr:hypothetical protein HMPREF9075_02176 [Capnocytophaga sp. oral taxon 332 str. F0381]
MVHSYNIFIYLTSFLVFIFVRKSNFFIINEKNNYICLKIGILSEQSFNKEVLAGGIGT